MNAGTGTSILKRIVWKEYRQQRALWLAILIAGIVLQVAAVAYYAMNRVEDIPQVLFTIALSVPVLYALGCGAALFAGEHEARTFAFQQALPASALRVFAGKVSFALVSALALFPLLWLVAWGISGWTLPAPSWHAQLWAGGVLATLEVLIWSVLFSLLLRHVLPVAVLGGAFAAVLGCVSFALVAAFHDSYASGINEYWQALPLRGGCALVAALVAARLAAHWFDERPSLWRNKEKVSPLTVARTRHRRNFVWLRQAFCLVGHEWRQSWPTLATYLGAYVVLTGWLMSVSRNDPPGELFIVLLPVLAAIMGASIFWSDHSRQQYRFFAERGIGPRQAWFSRQLAWGLILAVVALLVTFLVQASPTHHPELWWQAIGLSILAFSVGQVCSLFIASGIVAIFAGVACSVLLLMWAGYMSDLGEPYLVSCLPLPFIFWFATWLRVPAWHAERTSWQGKAWALASLAVPLLTVIAATAAYRVYEIPRIAPSSLPTADAVYSPAARETAEMYREADALLRPRISWDEEGKTIISARDEDWRRGIAWFLAASRRESCRFHWPMDFDSGSAFDGRQVTHAVLAEARQLADENELDAAAELYLALLRLAGHFYQQSSAMLYGQYGIAVELEVFAEVPNWAARPQQSAERIREFLARLMAWSAAHRPRWEYAVAEQQAVMRGFLRADDQILVNYLGLDSGQRTAAKLLRWLLPWERLRAERLLAIQTAADLQGLDYFRRAREAGTPPSPFSSWEVMLQRTNGQAVLLRDADIEAWLKTTPLLATNPTLHARSFADWNDSCFLHRHAVMTQLALMAWREEHGELPQTLTELLGHPFEKLPPDPYTGRPFVFVREGIEYETYGDSDFGMMGSGMFLGGDMMGAEISESPEPTITVERTDPFLWSPGSNREHVADESAMLSQGKRFFIPPKVPAAAANNEE